MSFWRGWFFESDVAGFPSNHALAWLSSPGISLITEPTQSKAGGRGNLSASPGSRCTEGHGPGSTLPGRPLTLLHVDKLPVIVLCSNYFSTSSEMPSQGVHTPGPSVAPIMAGAGRQLFLAGEACLLVAAASPHESLPPSVCAFPPSVYLPSLCLSMSFPVLLGAHH